MASKPRPPQIAILESCGAARRRTVVPLLPQRCPACTLLDLPTLAIGSQRHSGSHDARRPADAAAAIDSPYHDRYMFVALFQPVAHGASRRQRR